MNEADHARQVAMNFEAVKVRLTQSKDGYILQLSIHPNEVPEPLLRAWVGTRYMCALVELADDNQPTGDVSEGERMIKSAGILCQSPEFQDYMSQITQDFIADTKQCAISLRAILKIESRTELKTNAEARNRFQEIRQQFEAFERQKNG